MNENETALVPVPATGEILNKTNETLAIRRGSGISGGYVPHIDQAAVSRMMQAAAGTRTGERDGLLIAVLFDSCLRVSEALNIRPCDLTGEGLKITDLKHGKGAYSTVAISQSLKQKLFAYCYDRIAPEVKIFPINRTRVFQIISRAMKQAGITKPEGVGSVHVLRHSGAIERLRRSGNAREVQEQLRHRQPNMTLRYLKTITHAEAVRNQSAIDLW